MVEHPIKTSGEPIRQPMHRLPALLKDTVNSQRRNVTPWCNPTQLQSLGIAVVMVKTKGGTWRFCVDYRKVNTMTHHDAYPLSHIDATLGSLAGSTLFTTLELEPSDKEKKPFPPPKDISSLMLCHLD